MVEVVLRDSCRTGAPDALGSCSVGVVVTDAGFLPDRSVTEWPFVCGGAFCVRPLCIAVVGVGDLTLAVAAGWAGRCVLRSGEADCMASVPAGVAAGVRCTTCCGSDADGVRACAGREVERGVVEAEDMGVAEDVCLSVWKMVACPETF